MRSKLNGLDLFSGIGGNSLALGQWINTVAYCEADRYAQAVLLSRMADGALARRPIWDDVRTLNAGMLPPIDIIVAGFPCQDISSAGRGAGLDGERSGLFFEIMRLAEEAEPSFLFLENVPAIRTRGLDRVVGTLSGLGYDCRWSMLSAYDVGASHKRERWFLLAYANGMWKLQRRRAQWQVGGWALDGGQKVPGTVAHADEILRQERRPLRERDADARVGCRWQSEPDVGRVVNGLPRRMDRIKCLGNAVVPAQAQEAFKRLMGL